MAFSGENAYLTWQRVKIALAGADPYFVRQFKELKATLSQVYPDTDLQFIAFTEVQADVAGGTAILTGACTFLAVYVKKENEGTDNLFLIYDDATNDTTDANARIALSLLDANHEASAVYPKGMAIATGILVTQYTSASGLGKADGSNGGNGFVLIKA